MSRILGNGAATVNAMCRAGELIASGGCHSALTHNLHLNLNLRETGTPSD